MLDPQMSTPPAGLGKTMPWRAVVLTAAICLCLGTSSAWSQSQLMISIAYQGPSAPTNGGAVDPGAVHFTFPGSWATPSPFWGPANLGIMPAAYNSAEVDAMSWGKDSILKKDGGYWGGNYRIFFSTDEFAGGVPGSGPFTVRSEGAGTARESSADVQRTQLMMTLPLPPFVYGHQKTFDGNGVGPFIRPDLGLIEPNFPTPGPDSGDTIDALDIWQQSSDMRLYFSLDANWTDPLEGFYGNSGTAMTNGVRPGDVLVSNGTGSFGVWAPASSLGLGTDDDLDALILWENGNGVFNPSSGLFDWMGGTTDMLLFSVRRGSPVIGMLDSNLSIPIEEGDILTTPCTALPCSGGFTPAIFIPAESLRLGTVRSGTDAPFVGFGDDLDALMVR